MVAVSEVQLLGLFFAAGMMYMTWVYYRKELYTRRDLAAWFLIWTGFLIASAAPFKVEAFLNPVIEMAALNIFLVLGYMALITVVFFLYSRMRELSRKLENVVMAIDDT